jgi:hypothetical protein
MKLTLLCLILLLLISCEKEEVLKEVQINYEFTDDVSPVKVKFNVDGDFHWSEWIFDERFSNSLDVSEDVEKSEWIFMDSEGSGFAKVKFSGSDKNNGKYFGEKVIHLPKVATKVEFTGFSAQNLFTSFPDINGLYKVEFTLHDPLPTTRKSFILNLNHLKGESIKFEQPVLFDIPRFYENAEHYIVVSISRNNESQPYFRTNFFLKTTYLSDRLISGKIQIGSNEKLLFLEADWKP